MKSGKYFFDLIADSERGLEEIAKKCEFNGRLKITIVRKWLIRSDPEGFLEDYDLAGKYIKSLNSGSISIKHLPYRLR